MNYGVIDLGSNSIRLSVYKYENGQVSLLIDKKVMAGMASYVSEGIPSSKGISKACGILNHYKEILHRFGITEIHPFATASLRNVQNSQEAKEEILKNTGLNIEILSGEEEARLDFTGAIWFYPLDKGLLIDIGGGSFELVSFENGQVKALTSIPLGSLNLFTKHVKGFTPTDEERRKMKKNVNNELDALKWVPDAEIKMLCGIGGTLRAALKLSKDLLELPYDENNITAKHVAALNRILKSASPKDYHMIYRVVPARILSIQPGLIILNEVIKRFGIERIMISKGGVREGYLLGRIIKDS